MKLPIRSAIALAAMAPSLAYAAAPAAPAGSHDVKCLMLANLYARAASAAQGREAASQARLFYLGRVSLRLSGPALTAAMTAQAKTVSPDQSGTEMTKCQQTVQTSAAAITAAGRSVLEKVEPAGPPVSGPDAGAKGPATGR